MHGDVYWRFCDQKIFQMTMGLPGNEEYTFDILLPIRTDLQMQIYSWPPLIGRIIIGGDVDRSGSCNILLLHYNDFLRNSDC